MRGSCRRPSVRKKPASGAGRGRRRCKLIIPAAVYHCWRTCAAWTAGERCGALAAPLARAASLLLRQKKVEAGAAGRQAGRQVAGRSIDCAFASAAPHLGLGADMITESMTSL